MLGEALLAQCVGSHSTALASLFSTAASPPPQQQQHTSEDKAAAAQEDTTQDSDKEEEDKEAAAARKLERTVFVGNVPVGAKAKEVKRVFKGYGRVESVRFRSVPVVRKGKEPRRYAVLRGEVIEGRTTMCAFVVFADDGGKGQRAAAAAIAGANGTVFADHHLHVTAAAPPRSKSKTTATGATGATATATAGAKEFPAKRSVFVGNLPFAAEEEALRAHFADCGDVVAVRIVRDSTTALGLGYGFVAFADRLSVTTALLKDGADFEGRPLRVTRCLDHDAALRAAERRKKQQQQQQSSRSSPNAGKPSLLGRRKRASAAKSKVAASQKAPSSKPKPKPKRSKKQPSQRPEGEPSHKKPRK